MRIEKNDKVSIQENFLAEEKFNTLAEALTNQFFPWYFKPYIDYTDEEEKATPGLFIHVIYKDSVPRSPFYESHFLPVLEALNASLLFRIFINLNSRLPEPYFGTFHSDTNASLGEKMAAQWTTSILYINTNNGYTELESGERIESVANRLVSFPSNTRHRLVSQTDEQGRIVINFNYLKLPPGARPGKFQYL